MSLANASSSRTTLLKDERRAAAEALLVPPVEALNRPGWELVRCRAEVLRPSRSRPVVRYLVTSRSPGGTAMRWTAIGKGYNRGGGAAVHRALTELWAAGFDDPALAVPEPLGWEPQRNLLVQGEAPPATLHDELHALEPDLDAVAASGAWLAKLHAVDVSSPALAPGFERRKLGDYAEGLDEAAPGLGARWQALVAGTLEALEALPDQPVVLTHGDYQPKNVHLAPGQVVAIDLDRLASAPAARDLGHFVGQSATMSAARTGGFAACLRFLHSFLDGYIGGGGDVAALEALPAYVARTFVEVLYYRLVVRPVPDPSFADAWLDEAERWLGAGPHAL